MADVEYDSCLFRRDLVDASSLQCGNAELSRLVTDNHSPGALLIIKQASSKWMDKRISWPAHLLRAHDKLLPKPVAILAYRYHGGHHLLLSLSENLFLKSRLSSEQIYDPQDATYNYYLRGKLAAECFQFSLAFVRIVRVTRRNFFLPINLCQSFWTPWCCTRSWKILQHLGRSPIWD